MRLKHRMKVDLPQPDGPMNAVTKFFRISSDDVVERERPAVGDRESLDVEDDLAAAVVGVELVRELADLGWIDSGRHGNLGRRLRHRRQCRPHGPFAWAAVG